MKKKLENYQQLGLLVQLITSVCFLVAMIYAWFEPVFLDLVYLMMGLLLLAIAFNNHVFYKRKYFTVIYLIGALIAFLAVVL